MMRLGILTLNGYTNYGNVLQNLALQSYLAGQGHDVETIWYSPLPPTRSKLEILKSHMTIHSILQAINNKVNVRRNRLKNNMTSARVIHFKKFCQTNINYSPIRLNDNNIQDPALLKRIDDTFDAFFSGSDQVWGLYGNRVLTAYFLPFVPSSKRNSFAASFGFSQIPNSNLESTYRNGLREMNCISVRELEGADIVKSVAGISPTTLLDPTLLLSSERWHQIASRPDMNLPSRYLLTYFLGESNEQQLKFVQKVADSSGAKIIRLNDLSDENAYGIAPDNFVYLFEHATYVITDSFHGAVFSIIFKRDFFVTSRHGGVDMSSRLTTLLKRMALDDRLVSSIDGFDVSLIHAHIDYSTSSKVIADNKLQANKFISEALHGIEI